MRQEDNAKNFLIEWNGEARTGDVWRIHPESGEKIEKVADCVWRSSQGTNGDESPSHHLGIRFPGETNIKVVTLQGKLNWNQIVR